MPREVPLSVEERVYDAALLLYGETGWSGFNLTKVAERAGVGKSSLYSRWPTAETLLLTAFQHAYPRQQFTGKTLYEVLYQEIDARIRAYLGRYSAALRRLMVESPTGDVAVINQACRYVCTDPLETLRQGLWYYKKAGQIPEEVSIVRLVDAIEGSILLRSIWLPPQYVDCFLEKIPQYAHDLITDLLPNLACVPRPVASPCDMVYDTMPPSYQIRIS
ncbi:TetR/AcrR family transcriptional regulator [Trueperella pecoris]|uniref:TetR/AcrR family transcriptional regulator n=1 Tax=Trueperella pecoris TaxID=2733571 RepID=UPI001C20C579|nr:TetR/AcrR family transcriptional regulator [Trueperella pecoris]